MIDVLFIQGASEGAHSADERLAENLARHLGPDYRVRFPRMPNEGKPRFAVWATAFSQELAATRADFVLVGHSLGGSFLLRYLALNEVQPRPLAVFVASAPFIGEQGWPDGDFELPAAAARARLQHTTLTLFQGEADEVVPPAHLSLYQQAFPAATVHRLPYRDHQLREDLSEVAEAIRQATVPAT